MTFQISSICRPDINNFRIPIYIINQSPSNAKKQTDFFIFLFIYSIIWNETWLASEANELSTKTNFQAAEYSTFTMIQNASLLIQLSNVLHCWCCCWDFVTDVNQDNYQN